MQSLTMGRRTCRQRIGINKGACFSADRQVPRQRKGHAPPRRAPQSVQPRGRRGAAVRQVGPRLTNPEPHDFEASRSPSTRRRRAAVVQYLERSVNAMHRKQTHLGSAVFLDTDRDTVRCSRKGLHLALELRPPSDVRLIMSSTLSSGPPREPGLRRR